MVAAAHGIAYRLAFEEDLPAVVGAGIRDE